MNFSFISSKNPLLWYIFKNLCRPSRKIEWFHSVLSHAASKLPFFSEQGLEWAWGGNPGHYHLFWPFDSLMMTNNPPSGSFYSSCMIHLERWDQTRKKQNKTCQPKALRSLGQQPQTHFSSSVHVRLLRLQNFCKNWKLTNCLYHSAQHTLRWATC